MDPRTLIEGVFAVAMLFASLWIKGIREDVRELLNRVNDHGERIAVLESKEKRRR
jgi:hypothetical protein